LLQKAENQHGHAHREANDGDSEKVQHFFFVPSSAASRAKSLIQIISGEWFWF
jgi:hypothetical protein